MPPGDYSEELVELVARAFWSETQEPIVYCRNAARAVLDALSSSGRLVPEGSEVREEHGFMATLGETIAPAVHRRLTTPWTPSEPAQETPNA